jgi:hypothetical protein
LNVGILFRGKNIDGVAYMIDRGVELDSSTLVNIVRAAVKDDELVSNLADFLSLPMCVDWSHVFAQRIRFQGEQVILHALVETSPAVSSLFKRLHLSRRSALLATVDE